MHPGRHDLLLSDCTELWDSIYKINPPVAEEILCMEKHHRRITFFYLDSGNDQGQATQEKGCFRFSSKSLLPWFGETVLEEESVPWEETSLGSRTIIDSIVTGLKNLSMINDR